MKIRKVTSLLSAPQMRESVDYLVADEYAALVRTKTDSLGRPLIDIVTPQPRSSHTFRSRVVRPSKTRRTIQRKRRIQ